MTPLQLMPMQTSLVAIAQEQFDRAELSFRRCDDKEYEQAAARIARRYGLMWQWSETGRIEFEEME